MDIKKTVGKRIQDFRKSKGFTQEKLAEVVGIDTISLSKIETGRNYPTAENLTKIAHSLNIEEYELFVTDCVKSNSELLDEIKDGLEKIKKDNKKLHVLAAVIRSLS